MRHGVRVAERDFGAAGRQITYLAIHRRRTFVEGDHAAKQRARAGGCPFFNHGLAPDEFRDKDIKEQTRDKSTERTKCALALSAMVTGAQFWQRVTEITRSAPSSDRNVIGCVTG